ncbi:MAG: hypothetical protein ACWA6X_11530 [Bauldia sp.]
MNTEKDRKAHAGADDDRQDRNRNDGPAQQQAGQPGVNQNAQFQDRQNRDFQRDATREMHDQLSGDSGGNRQQQPDQKAGRDRDANRQPDRDASRMDRDRNASGQQQADQKPGKDDRQQQGKDAGRSGSHQQK